MTRADRKYWKKEAKKAAKRARGSWFSRRTKGQKIALVLLALIICGAGVFAGVSIKYLDKQVSAMNIGVPIEEFDERELSCVDVDGFLNILLIGIDARDINSTDGARGDALIVASIEEETGKITLTSIYRDTYLKSGGYDFYDKITHSFSYGGPKETIKTVNQAMDLNITKYVMFNFKAVADVVDALGGITINVEEYEIEQLNKYADETADIIGRTESPQVTKPGEQVLVGTQAVSYGRIRKGVGDDFKRTERMRTVITKLLAKVKGLSVKEMDELVNITVPQIQTNLNTNDVLALAFNAGKYHIAGSSGFPYSVTTGYLNEVSYVFPTDLYGDVVKLHENVFNQAGYEPSEMVQEMNYRILTDIGVVSNQTVVNVEEYYENPAEQPELLLPDVGEPLEIPEYEPIYEEFPIQEPEEGGNVEEPLDDTSSEENQDDHANPPQEEVQPGNENDGEGQTGEYAGGDSDVQGEGQAEDNYGDADTGEGTTDAEGENIGGGEIGNQDSEGEYAGEEVPPAQEEPYSQEEQAEPSRETVEQEYVEDYGEFAESGDYIEYGEAETSYGEGEAIYDEGEALYDETSEN